jgi:hypothetical protein
MTTFNKHNVKILRIFFAMLLHFVQLFTVAATLLLALNSTSGDTVYKPPLVVWRKAVWNEAALQYH